MAKIVDLSDLINLQSGGNNGTPTAVFFHKIGNREGAATAQNPGRMLSWWWEGGIPATGVDPGNTLTVCDNTTQGALPMSAPGSGRQKWLVQVAHGNNRSGTFVLYDRLIHRGGFNMTSTSAQTVQGSPPVGTAITRNTDGKGNRIMVEVYQTGLGNTTSTLIADYIDQDGNAATTKTVVIAGNNNNNPTSAWILPFANGDTGVKSVTSITLGTAITGNIIVSIIHPIITLNSPLSCETAQCDFSSGLPTFPELLGTECLAGLYCTTSNQARLQWGYIATVEK